MEISITKLPQSEIEITGEISAGDFDVFCQKAVKKLGSEISIPGFRSGNVPENILSGRVGEKAILERAAEIAIQETYPKILGENKIDAVGRPEITITKIARGNPLGFKIKTAIIPEFTLPDYKSIAKKALEEKPAKIEVSEKEIDDALQYLRKVRSSSGENGAKGGETPKETFLPEINDEFAKSLGKFETVEDLKKTIRENILFEKRVKEKEKIREKILIDIADKTSVEAPEILIESQKERMMNHLKENLAGMRMDWNGYLAQIKKTEEELKKEWQKEAQTRVKYGLILDKLALEENIKISDEELDQKLKELSAHYKEGVNKGIDENRLKDYAYGIIRNEKIFQMLGASR